MSDETTAEAPLDDIMLAMDVVDTLRHREMLVERELQADDRDRRMKQRLREIYASQGIEVPDHVLEQGVAALKEGRFVYDPPVGGLQIWLARMYVSRGRWGKPLLLVLALALALWLSHAALVRWPAERAAAALPAELQVQYETLAALAAGPLAKERAQSLRVEGESALKRGDKEAVEATIQRMATLQQDIEMAYDLRIAAHPGERSGVWRIPDANPGARNYYILVEAVGPHGELQEVPVLSEEDGKVYRVSRWGLRVDEALFERVAADKSDDGIIQNNRFGVKKRGYLTPEYLMPTSGAAITRW